MRHAFSVDLEEWFCVSNFEHVLDRGSWDSLESRVEASTERLLELADEDGYLGRLSFPMTKQHGQIRPGARVRCIVLSDRKDFSRVAALPDAWLPGLRLWAGEYPFLLRPAFEELCQLRLAGRRQR